MTNVTIERQEIESFAADLEQAQPREILAFALEKISSITLASSFGSEDMVLIDIISQLNPAAEIFYLDTDFLFPETYTLIKQVIEHYGLRSVTRVRPEMSVEEQVRIYGDNLCKTDPDLCLEIRKIKPLIKHLKSYDGWITGIRRDQTANRANAKVVEWDKKFNLIKINPLVRWTSDDVWAYIRSHNVPYNPLHDQGYPSIGCVNCTMPVKPGEDPRSGRWATLEKTECGLHQ